MINHNRVFVGGFRHGGNSIAYWFILKESRFDFLSLLCCSEVLHLNCTFACDVLCYYCLLGPDLLCVLGFTEIYHTRLWYALIVLAIIFELSAWQRIVHMSKLRSRKDSILTTVRMQLRFCVNFIEHLFVFLCKSLSFGVLQIVEDNLFQPRVIGYRLFPWCL